MTARNRLKELRKGKGLKQTDLAALLEVVPRQYQRYERNEQDPSLETAIVLADFYDVSLDYLVGRSDDPKRYGRPAEEKNGSPRFCVPEAP